MRGYAMTASNSGGRSRGLSARGTPAFSSKTCVAQLKLRVIMFSMLVALPDGVEALASHVEAPSELARRLAQIGHAFFDRA